MGGPSGRHCQDSRGPGNGSASQKGIPGQWQFSRRSGQVNTPGAAASLHRTVRLRPLPSTGRRCGENDFAPHRARRVAMPNNVDRGSMRFAVETAQLSFCFYPCFPAGLSAAGQENAAVTPPQLRGVGIDQRLNNQVPLDLKFRDESGQTVTLGSYFGKKPVILSLVYYSLPDAVYDGGKRPFECLAGCEVQHRRTIRSRDSEH